MRGFELEENVVLNKSSSSHNCNDKGSGYFRVKLVEDGALSVTVVVVVALAPDPTPTNPALTFALTFRYTAWLSWRIHVKSNKTNNTGVCIVNICSEHPE